jgi:hypothetical protein
MAVRFKNKRPKITDVSRGMFACFLNSLRKRLEPTRAGQASPRATIFFLTREPLAGPASLTA